MSDLFHENVSFEFINAVFTVMSDCDKHTFIILTKRPERIIEFVKWKQKQVYNIIWSFPFNVWLLVSVEDQATANERIPLLLKVPCIVRGLSCEPLLGAIDIKYWIDRLEHGKHSFHSTSKPKINWVIVGGESGKNARPMYPRWARAIGDQCKAAGIPFFFKQWGEWKPVNRDELQNYLFTKTLHIDEETCFAKLGKHSAGNKLDGNVYQEFPKTSF
jgi:protein gp37